MCKLSADQGFQGVSRLCGKYSFRGEGFGQILFYCAQGWIIETPEEAFDPGIATFMDFRIDQGL